MAAFALFNAGTQDALFSGIAAARGLLATYQRSVVSVGGVTTQRIEGGSQMYKKNTSAKFAFKSVDTDGNGVTGLTITAKTGKDGAAPTTATNAVVESGSGWYYITLTATEMNGDLIVLDLSASGATIAPITVSTESDYTAARAAHLDADISSRMATYTQPTGFLAATFPGTVASTTNITAGTVTTATNVTTVNGLAAGVITATSIAADAITDNKVASDVTIASVTGAVGSVAGNVGGNVVGSVASVTAGVTVTTNNDKTGYALSSGGVQAVWDELTSSLTTVGSIGKKLADANYYWS